MLSGVTTLCLSRRSKNKICLSGLVFDLSCSSYETGLRVIAVRFNKEAFAIRHSHFKQDVP